VNEDSRYGVAQTMAVELGKSVTLEPPGQDANFL